MFFVRSITLIFLIAFRIRAASDYWTTQIVKRTGSAVYFGNDESSIGLVFVHRRMNSSTKQRVSYPLYKAAFGSLPGAPESGTLLIFGIYPRVPMPVVGRGRTLNQSKIDLLGHSVHVAFNALYIRTARRQCQYSNAL